MSIGFLTIVINVTKNILQQHAVEIAYMSLALDLWTGLKIRTAILSRLIDNKVIVIHSTLCAALYSCTVYYVLFCTVLYCSINCNDNNNSTNANVYGAVIMAQPLREFTRFIWLNVARAPGGCRPLDQADQLEPIDPPVGSYRNYIHHRRLLLLS